MLNPMPQQPDWSVDWAALRAAHPWLEPLHACPQNPEYHGEGDVGTHTRMVCEALAADPAWRTSPWREEVWAAALLHDVAKPDGDENHASRGARFARRLLWEAGVSAPRRERVVKLVRHHMHARNLLSEEHSLRFLLELSLSLRCDQLALLCDADARGRICADQSRLLEEVELFREYAREHGCYDRPYEFPSELARFEFFRKTARQPDYVPHEKYRCQVIVLSGLPGAGKDTWVQQNVPYLARISLDGLRQQMGIPGSAPQARVVDAARSRARDYLRAGRDFVWNATNLSRDLRGRVLQLMFDYGARVRLVYLEADREELARRNAERGFPWSLLERMLDRWEVPEPWEAHQVDYLWR